MYRYLYVHSASHTLCVHFSVCALLKPPDLSTKCFSVFAGPSAAPGPNPEQSTGGTDRRGRQKITWQPPTASQKESDAQVHILTMSLLSQEFSC